jgi:peptidoglycan/LPS O-acetylase OafA/YrhL
VAAGIGLNLTDLGVAASFTWDYRRLFPPGSGSPAFGQLLTHSWSLAIEEQFYLLWPAVFLLGGPLRARTLAVVAIAAMPLLRVALFFLAPAWRGETIFQFHANLDRLLFGCLLALLAGDEGFETALGRWQSPAWPMSALAYLLVLEPMLEYRLGGLFALPFGISLEAASWTFLIAWLLRHPQSRGSRLLNRPSLVVLGGLSYSLYLWQQPFSQRVNTTLSGRFPFSLPCILAAALASYFLVERPFNRLRARFRNRPPAAERRPATP